MWMKVSKVCLLFEIPSEPGVNRIYQIYTTQYVHVFNSVYELIFSVVQ